MTADGGQRKKISPQLVIFDIDGTLVNAFPAVVSSLNFATTRLGYPPQDPEVIERNVGWGERHLLSRFVRPEDIEPIIAHYREHHQTALLTGTSFMPGAAAILPELSRQGYQIAVATNRPQWSTEIILKVLNIRHFFAAIVAGDMVARPKPAPDMLNQILKVCCVEADSAVFVGDMTVDVETGHNAGVRVIAVTTGTSTLAEIQALRPFGVVSSLDEIWQLIS
ncbi:MAG: HAD family hydrolase [Candidatus Omnitrophica bacterium]|nr:HAD family hydrolase [Candidatus Omnitrophota bacterium]